MQLSKCLSLAAQNHGLIFPIESPSACRFTASEIKYLFGIITIMDQDKGEFSSSVVLENFSWAAFPFTHLAAN